MKLLIFGLFTFPVPKSIIISFQLCYSFSSCLRVSVGVLVKCIKFLLHVVYSHTLLQRHLQVFKKGNSEIFCNKKNVDEKVKHPIFLSTFPKIPAFCLWLAPRNGSLLMKGLTLDISCYFPRVKAPKFYFRLDTNW